MKKNSTKIVVDDNDDDQFYSMDLIGRFDGMNDGSLNDIGSMNMYVVDDMEG